MDTSEAVETSGKLLAWFNDYGALQVLALCGLLWPVVMIACYVYAIKRIGKPLNTIAYWIDKMPKGEDTT